MSVSVWPSDLPNVALLAGLQHAPMDGRLRTATDTGPGKARLNNSATPRPAKMQLVLSRNETMRLHRFWSEELGEGVKPFLIRDQLIDGAYLTTRDGSILTDRTGNRLTLAAWWLVKFGSAPQESMNRGLSLNVQFDLLILR